MELTQAIRKEADTVTEMTADEAARKLPNVLGVMASNALRTAGFYSYEQGGKKHLIVKA